MLSAEPPDPGQNVRIDGFKKENVAEVTPRDFQITPSRAVRKRGSPSSPLRRAQVGRLRREFKDDPPNSQNEPKSCEQTDLQINSAPALVGFIF